MTSLTPGKVFRSRGPTLAVENKLDPGAWTFELVVVDNDGNASKPARLTVKVARPGVVVPPVRGPLDPRLVDPRIPTPTPTPAPVSPRPIDPRILGTGLAPGTATPVTPATPRGPIIDRIITRRPG